MANQTWKDDLAAREGEHLNEFLELLRMPSISTEPQHAEAVKETADWVADRLRKAGVPEVVIAESKGHPSVLGRWHVADDQPTILIYGHYDVQPVEPLDLWVSPPFEPELRDGTIVARGSSDMKGNLLTAVQGVEAAARANGGQPPINVSFIFEGEEEIGSPHFRDIIREHKDFLHADAVISADGGQFSEDTPSLGVSLKGLGGVQVNLTTANTDLHSGSYGAWVPNAVQAMVQLAATFHDKDGRVQVAGFYDAVRELTQAERDEVALLPIDEEEAKQKLDVDALWGEAGFSPRERQWTRPTLDLNGIWGGFQGEGVKTVTPSQAHLKITCRLVADQDPANIVELIRAHVEANRPPGATVEVVPLPGSARPYAVDRNHPVFGAVSDILSELYGKDPVIVRAGGTVPATGIFQDELGVETITLGWGLPDSKAHAPNEWYRVEDYNRGRVGYAMLLERLKK
ncbi:MAG TPA: dipeptidase [Thermomicrobiales bacterium]|nr:dipeptidase [Thermomicrobiales bacterium]